jgi:hypothetical protein
MLNISEGDETNNIFNRITNFFRNRTIFIYQNLYLLERDASKLGEIENKGVESITLTKKKDLEDLLKKGYTTGEFCRLSDLTEKFFRSQVLFGIFYKKKLVHISFLITEKKIEFHPPMKINFDKDVYVHWSITDPEYRGKGFYSYNLKKMVEFSSDLGKEKLKMAVGKDNIRSLRAAQHAGFEVYGEGRYMKFSKFVSWREKYYY